MFFIEINKSYFVSKLCIRILFLQVTHFVLQFWLFNTISVKRLSILHNGIKRWQAELKEAKKITKPTKRPKEKGRSGTKKKFRSDSGKKKIIISYKCTFVSLPSSLFNLISSENNVLNRVILFSMQCLWVNIMSILRKRG